MDQAERVAGGARKPRPPAKHSDPVAVAAALEEVRTNLTVSVDVAGLLLKVGRNVSYREAASGRIPAIRIGGQLRVPTAALREMLGLQAA